MNTSWIWERRVRREVGAGWSGFTLVELLVVIGIIGLLLSILLPALSRVRATANETVCMSNLKQWGIGFQTYCDANHGYLPNEGPDGSNNGTQLIGVHGKTAVPVGGATGIDDGSLWYNAIPPLVGGKSYYQMVSLDPSAEVPPRTNFTGPVSPLPTYGHNSIFICPAAGPPGTLTGTAKVSSTATAASAPALDTISPDGSFFLLYGVDPANRISIISNMQFKSYFSYVYNSMLFGTTNDGVAHTEWKMAQMRPASSVVLLVEKIAAPSEFGLPKQVCLEPWMDSSGTNEGYTNNIGQLKANWKRFTTRHRAGGYLLFADGHVAWFSWNDVNAPQETESPSTVDGNQPDKGLIWNPWVYAGVGAKTNNTD